MFQVHLYLLHPPLLQHMQPAKYRLRQHSKAPCSSPTPQQLKADGEKKRKEIICKHKYTNGHSTLPLLRNFSLSLQNPKIPTIKLQNLLANIFSSESIKKVKLFPSQYLPKLWILSTSAEASPLSGHIHLLLSAVSFPSTNTHTLASSNFKEMHCSRLPDSRPPPPFPCFSSQ